MRSSSQKYDVSLSKIRRFALIIALILITYSIAGVKLDVPAKMQPLGIPLIIERPDLIAIGLVIASLYSIFKFVYYGMVIHSGQYNPMRAKKRLLSGKLVDPTAYVEDLEDFQNQVKSDILRYFPHGWKGHPDFECSQCERVFSFKVPKMSRLTRWSARLEDLDFLAPLFANLGALTLWFYSFISPSLSNFRLPYSI